MVGGHTRPSRVDLRFVGGRSVEGSRRSGWTIPAVIAGLASLTLAPLSPALTEVTHGLTVIAIGILLIWGPRRHEPLSRTRWLLVAALGAVLLSELITIGFQLITGHTPTTPWAGDYVALLYSPLTIAGLLLVPGSRRTDHRLRALCDGLFAAGSLWFLIAAVADTHVRAGLGHGEWTSLTSLAIAAGDVCVVATALAVLSRCSPSVTRTVGGIAAGITVIAIDDIWLLVSQHSGYSWQSVTLVQIGPAPARAHGRAATDPHPGIARADAEDPPPA